MCWARALRGCSDRMSKEHVLSEAVNEALDRTLGLNLPGPDALRIGAHAQKVELLCDTHNSMLSDLDTEAGNFVTKLRGYFNTTRKIADGNPAIFNIYVDGGKLERWGLKTYFNFAVWHGCIGTDLPSSEITGDRIVNYVFTGQPKPPDYGLFATVPTKALSVAEINQKIFAMNIYSANVQIFRPSANAVIHEFVLPTHLNLTLFGVDLGFSANITPYNDLFGANQFGNVQNLQKGAELRPDGIFLRPFEANLGPEHFTELRIYLQW